MEYLNGAKKGKIHGPSPAISRRQAQRPSGGGGGGVVPWYPEIVPFARDLGFLLLLRLLAPP